MRPCGNDAERQREPLSSPGAVGVRAVEDAYDRDDVVVVVDLVDDAVRAATGRILPRQRSPQRLPDALRIFGQRSVNEVPAGRGDLLRQCA